MICLITLVIINNKSYQEEKVNMREPIARAIQILGSQRKLAISCNVSQPAICKWLKGQRVSAEYVNSIVQATNGMVKASELRPDIFNDQPY